MPTTKIQQHYFTREREGVFRTNEGFDTVAKSEGLAPEWIKAALHPYCVYKAPKALLERGEKDDRLFPASLCVFHAESGELVIGRTVYVGADFTGQRSAFFTHQYIVPADRKDDFIREPNRLFRINSFDNHHDIREGKSIPELDDIEYEATISLSGQERTLSRLGIDKTRFQQLVCAVMASVGNKRKVYIALDTDVSSVADDAGRLLQIVYRCLPYAVRRQLGVLTYNSEPEGKRNLHVMFVERGSIRQQDRSLDRDHLFDFPNGRFVNTELKGQDPSYFDFLWNARNDPEKLKEWFDFCEESLHDSDASTSLDITTYGRLYALYEIEQGSESLYEADPAGILGSILQYVNADTVRRNGRVNELFLRLVKREAMAGGLTPAAEYVKCLLDYYKLAEEGAKALLVRCFVVFVKRVVAQSAETSPDEGMEQSAWIFEQLLLNDAVFAKVFRELYARSPQTAEQYVAYRTDKAGSVKALLEEIEFWLKYTVDLVALPFFAHQVLKKIKKLLQAERSGRIAAGSILYRYFDQLPGHEGRSALEEFCGRMRLEIQLDVLEALAPGGISYEALVRLGYILESVDYELERSLTKGQKQNLTQLALLYKVFTSDDGDEIEAALEQLGPVDLDRLQGAIMRMVDERIGPVHFGHIPYAFYVQSLSGASVYASKYDYDRMLEFVAASTRGTDTIYDFMVWSSVDSRFLNSSGGLDPNYRAAVDKYFDTNDRRATRNKQFTAKLLSSDNRSFQTLIQAIKLKQSGKLTRFFHANRKKMLRVGLILLPIVLLLAVFRTPVSEWIASFGPPPVLVVEPLPAMTDTASRTLKAGLAEANADVKIFVNGQYAGSGSIDTVVTLHDGDNDFEIVAVGPNGKKSETVRQTIAYKAPAPVVTVTALPDKTKTDTVTVKASATDSTDAKPKIYINGQLAGEGTVSKAIRLQAGDNTIVVKAENKSGKMSEPVEKIVKYETGK